MKSLIKICFVLCFILNGCGERKENKDKNKIVCGVTKWENGKVKSEGCFINDSIKEGLFKRYYPSGKLEYEINYHNNKENGPYIKYHENGKKYFFYTFKNGVKSGVTGEYFENGRLKIFQVYKAFNLNDHPGFGIDFLENGEVKNVHGEPIVDRLVNKDTLHVGDTLRILFQVAVPDSSKVLLHFYEDVATKTNGAELKVNEKDGIAKYEKAFSNRGTIKWGGDYLIKLGNGERINFDFEGVSIVK